MSIELTPLRHELEDGRAYTKGKAPPVDLLGADWSAALGRETPCTRCSVGPYLEFNFLYQRPVRTALSVLQSYR